jgi:hypothetical protein
MALRRKGSRTVVVDGRRYRWVISSRGEPVQGVVVELAEEPASRLVAYTNQFAVIAPAMVVTGVRSAVSAGWEPDRRGPDFRLADDLWGRPLLTP